MAEADLITPPTLRVAVAKPKFGIYYALLIIALCAMLIACLILYLEIGRLGGFGKVQGKVAAVERLNFLFLASNQEPAHHSAAAASAGLAPNSRSRSKSAAGSSFTS
jgi:hypothetical protein